MLGSLRRAGVSRLWARASLPALLGFGLYSATSLSSTTCGSGGGAPSAASVVRLAATESPSATPNHALPTLVLVHGLDSTRLTFRPFIEETAGRWNVLAVDQRGHGESPLGEEGEFSASAVAADLHAALEERESMGGSGKVVLVGHSMGGKVAMKFAADFPEKVAALVIEDMDIDTSPERFAAYTQVDDLPARRRFDRRFDSFEAAAEALLPFYRHDQARVRGWRVDGRVFERGDGSWWSGINPLAQFLASTHVLATVGRREWEAVGAAEYPVWVLVAGKGSVCGAASVEEMEELCPRARTLRFPEAGHSIHNTDRAGFVDAIEAVYAGLRAQEQADKERESGPQA